MRKATNKNWQRVTAAAAALALCAGVLTGCGASSSTAASSPRQALLPPAR
ncbi:MAG: hypothetical protein ACLUIR_07715 [Faecalibacterium prausnitzii]